jgi:thioredoxin-related protein
MSIKVSRSPTRGKTYGNKTVPEISWRTTRLPEAMKIFEYPTLIFFDQNANVINPVPGKSGC